MINISDEAATKYQAEHREAQLAVMRQGRANLPRPKDTRPEFQERIQKSYKRRLFKLIKGSLP